MLGYLPFLVAGLLTRAPQPPTPAVLFAPNVSETAADGAFVARSSAATTSIARDGTLTMTLGSQNGDASRVSIAPLGARTPRLEATDRQKAVLNLLIGRDPAQWRRGVPLYGRVRATDLYPGIDVEYYGTGSRLEYDFIVEPHADASAIRLKIGGGQVRQDAAGALVITTGAGMLRQLKPIAYQMAGQVREPVDVSYALKGSTVAFAIGRYDRSRPLVIDPLIVASTFAGGSRAVGLSFTTFGSDGVYVGGATQGSNNDVYLAKYSL